MKTLILKTSIIAMFFAINFGAQAQLTGRQIIEKVYNRPTGKDQTSELTMTLINKNGSERIRQLKQFIKDNGKIKKKIMFFISPADVRNTSFMNWSYDNSSKPDDQWIYLPALKKIKRISSESKSDYFMGSDFTYDDLGDRKVDDDTHKLLREESINGVDYYVVQSIPKDPDYMYSKTITWIRKDNFMGLKKEFYDEDGALLKMLHVVKFEKVSGILIITHSEMENVQKKHKTIMQLKNVKINTGISDSFFTERMMMRGI
ncbi:MAG: outer membrane lipoprotein-sorting protein [Bacteroidales bacterium]|nr:outer membrane lipoprotein-sorting protein [Bacteroidales bacterium]